MASPERTISFGLQEGDGDPGDANLAQSLAFLQKIQILPLCNQYRCKLSE